MRLVRLTTNYPAYLDQFYASRPGLWGKSYSEQHDALMSDCFGWVDYWKSALSKHEYLVWDVIGNVETLQKAWAKEHGVSYARGNWRREIVAAQVQHYRPEVLFVNDYNLYSPAFLRELRQSCASIRLILGWCGAPYRDASLFSEYDVVLSNISGVLDDLHEAGLDVEKMHHAFAPTVLNKIKGNASATSDFVFIGSVFLKDRFHLARAQMLAYLLKTTGIEICGQIKAPGFDSESKRKQRLKAFVKAAFERISDKAQKEEISEQERQTVAALKARAKPPVYGLRMFQKLSNSKISFNSHIDISLNESSNMRLFEATGVGSCVLTEASHNLDEIFDPDTEIVTYEDANDAAEKAAYLLDNEDLRERIASAGQRRTLRDHTFDVRAQVMDKLIKSRLG